MSAEGGPYITHCSFCGEGLLRFLRCSDCQEIVALCDECQLMWEDVERVIQDANCSSDSAFPRCPSCGARDAVWSETQIEELEELGLDQFVLDESL